MDLYRNSIGRRIGGESPDATAEELADLIDEAINNGEMVVIDKNRDWAWSDDVHPGDTGKADDPPMDTNNQTPPPAYTESN